MACCTAVCKRRSPTRPTAVPASCAPVLQRGRERRCGAGQRLPRRAPAAAHSKHGPGSGVLHSQGALVAQKRRRRSSGSARPWRPGVRLGLCAALLPCLLGRAARGAAACPCPQLTRCTLWLACSCPFVVSMLMARLGLCCQTQAPGRKCSGCTPWAAPRSENRPAVRARCRDSPPYFWAWLGTAEYSCVNRELEESYRAQGHRQSWNVGACTAPHTRGRAGLEWSTQTAVGG